MSYIPGEPTTQQLNDINSMLSGIERGDNKKYAKKVNQLVQYAKNQHLTGKELGPYLSKVTMGITYEHANRRNSAIDRLLKIGEPSNIDESVSGVKRGRSDEDVMPSAKRGGSRSRKSKSKSKSKNKGASKRTLRRPRI